MKKLLVVLLTFLPFTANAQFIPGQVLTASQLNNQFALYAPLAGATFSGPVAMGSLTVTGTANLPPIALSALAAQAANTVLANVTASSASPTAVALPSCSTSASALNYTSASGFTCNVAVNAAQLGGATFASPTSIGSTTPSTGAFTTLSASSTVSGTGFTNLFASPPSIGNTAAGTGAFTNLSSSGTVSGTGFSNYLASPPAIGSTAPSSGSFTSLAASGAISGTGFVNFFASPTGIGTVTPSIGAFTTLSATGTFTPSQTNGIVGTTTNNNANAGSVGEYVSSTVTSGAPVSISTGVSANVTSISLTAGDWDVQGTIGIIPSAVVSVFLGGISSTSANPGDSATGGRFKLSYSGASGIDLGNPTGIVRFSLASTTTVYLVVQAVFTGTCTTYGTILARRVR